MTSLSPKKLSHRVTSSELLATRSAAATAASHAYMETQVRRGGQGARQTIAHSQPDTASRHLEHLSKTSLWPVTKATGADGVANCVCVCDKIHALECVCFLFGFFCPPSLLQRSLLSAGIYRIEIGKKKQKNVQALGFFLRCGSGGDVRVYRRSND